MFFFDLDLHFGVVSRNVLNYLDERVLITDDGQFPPRSLRNAFIEQLGLLELPDRDDTVFIHGSADYRNYEITSRLGLPAVRVQWEKAVNCVFPRAVKWPHSLSGSIDEQSLVGELLEKVIIANR